MNWEEAVKQLKMQKNQQGLVKACFYDDPLIDAAKRYYESTEWKEVVDYLPKKKGKVLDIGAGSVVTKDVKPFSLVIGNPARFIKRIN